MKCFKLAICTLSLLTINFQAFALSNEKIASIDYTSDLSATVILANDQIHSDQSVSSMITSDVKIAINGGFFNSYYNASSQITYPSNSPVAYGAIIKDGSVINAGGTNNMIGFTYDGEILMDRVTVSPSILINSTHRLNAWGVNSIYDDASAFSIMTDELKHSFTVNSGTLVYTVKDNIVTQVSSDSTHTVEEGTIKLVFNSEAVAHTITQNNQPQVGDTAELAYTITPTTENDSWNNVKTAISGSRLLVLNGVNVSADTTYNSVLDNQDKQDNTSSLQRSYIYTTADGKLHFATATGSFSEIASTLVSRGAINAMGVDGGASSMLYNNGSYQTSAGRNLSTVLAIIPNDGSTSPEQPTQIVPEATVPLGDHEPSAWALEEVELAISKNYIPAWLQGSYRASITRVEFCALIYTYITETTGLNITQLIAREGADYSQFTFNDVDDSLVQVRGVAALGIVNGTGDGNFSPNNLLTREQAATMIMRMANVLGTTENNEVPVFSDSTSISTWAKEGVDMVTSAKIMNGNANGTFSPKGTYTREQAYITIINAYNSITLK